MKNKLINYILKHYPGMNDFRKEYQKISDKMLIEDAKMLLKIFNDNEHTKELSDLLDEFLGDERMDNSLICEKCGNNLSIKNEFYCQNCIAILKLLRSDNKKICMVYKGEEIDITKYFIKTEE